MLEGNLGNFVRLISKEKDLDVDVVKQAIEDAIASTARRPPLSLKNALPQFDIETGNLQILVQMKVVADPSDPKNEIDLKSARKINKDVNIGDFVETPLNPADFGRIAAQSVRQGIMQRLRDAEHDKIYKEFETKVGTVVTGIVHRFEHRNVIVQVGKVETILPQNEMPSGARYRYGDRIKVYIQDVVKTTRGPEVRISRACPELVVKLFEQEVPEIADNTVKIMKIAREPGVRTKIAVMSNNVDVDPVGACVGVKGSRVQMIVREMENEKIDIIPWSSDAVELIRAALNPAEVLSVTLHEESQTAQVIVSQNSLSLAIGKKGQNAKLAAKLTGWKIDILSEERQEILARMEELNLRYLEDFLSQMANLSQLARDALLKSPYNSVEKISKTAPGLLLAFTNGDLQIAENLVACAREYLEALEEMARELGDKDNPMLPPPGGVITASGEAGRSDDTPQTVENQNEAADEGGMESVEGAGASSDIKPDDQDTP